MFNTIFLFCVFFVCVACWSHLHESVHARTHWRLNCSHARKAGAGAGAHKRTHTLTHTHNTTNWCVCNAFHLLSFTHIHTYHDGGWGGRDFPRCVRAKQNGKNGNECVAVVAVVMMVCRNTARCAVWQEGASTCEHM